MNKEIETERINEFVGRGNFHAAINIAISAMNACRREEDQEGIDYFLEIIRTIVETMKEKFGSAVA